MPRMFSLVSLTLGFLSIFFEIWLLKEKEQKGERARDRKREMEGDRVKQKEKGEC